MSEKNTTISFIGGGNMARALIGGLRHNNPTARIHVVDINPDCLTQLEKQFGVTTSSQLDQHIANSDVIVLAVKPHQIKELAEKLLPFLTQQLIISIAAGIRVADLSRWLNNHTAIVRTMPNTPAMISQGITGMYADASVNEEQRAIADQILRSVGKTVWLDDEALINSLTAISGCGPAYVFYFIEAMQKAAEEMGLSHEQGRELALATFLGASQLANQSTESASTLRAQVTSKGGSTFAALQSMEQSGVADAFVTAMKAARARSDELGNT